MKIYYNPNLKSLSQNLRKSYNLSEVLLWNQIKGRKIGGYQFLRQKPIGNYIVDFYCKQLKLVIEVDGQSHDSKIDEDKTRQTYLESIGLMVMRFDDKDVKSNLESVLREIGLWVEGHPPTLREPPPFLRVKGEN